MNCEAGLLLNCENPTPGSHFCGESTLEQQMTCPANFEAFDIASDKRALSDMIRNLSNVGRCRSGLMSGRPIQASDFRVRLPV